VAPCLSDLFLTLNFGGTNGCQEKTGEKAGNEKGSCKEARVQDEKEISLLTTKGPARQKTALRGFFY